MCGDNGTKSTSLFVIECKLASFLRPTRAATWQSRGPETALCSGSFPLLFTALQKWKGAKRETTSPKRLETSTLIHNGMAPQHHHATPFVMLYYFGCEESLVVKVWDRDLWIRTETNPSAYKDKFRPGEQLFAACVTPRSSNVDFLQFREKVDARDKTREAAAATHARSAELEGYQKLVERQEKLLNLPEPYAECSQGDAAASADTIGRGSGVGRPDAGGGQVSADVACDSHGAGAPATTAPCDARKGGDGASSTQTTSYVWGDAER